MPPRLDALLDRRFWAVLFASAFGQVGEEPDPAQVCRQLGVAEDELNPWFEAFSGGGPELFDETDGVVDDPATIVVSLARGGELRVDIHPGDWIWTVRDDRGDEAKIANVGPHWALPGLRWQEVAAIARAAPGPGWVPTLLLLPTVWLTAGDEAHDLWTLAESAWSASGLVPEECVYALADLWIKAVEDGRDYRWERASDDDSWTCTAEWSTRWAGGPGSRTAAVNRLLGSVSA